MTSGIIVADIMTRNPVTVDPEASLLDCVKKMFKNKVGAVIITDKEKNFLGYIAQKEIHWAIIKKSEKEFRKIKAREISIKKLTTISPKASIEEAIKKLKKYRRLPVTQKGKLVGLITAKDILNFKPEFYPEFEELSKIREESEKLKRIKKLKERVFEGICEECGNYSSLYKSGEGLVCESCREK
ncbi:MAG: CBS domain-containing protein [Nanoarchaeota archaeon]